MDYFQRARLDEILKKHDICKDAEIELIEFINDVDDTAFHSGVDSVKSLPKD